MSKEPIKTHLHCPHCSANGCYSVWEDGSYYCHSCGAKPMKGQVKESTEEATHYEEKLKPYRKIGVKAIEEYGVTTSVDKEGKDIRRVYPYPHKEKYRYLPKDFSKNRGFTSDHLFGMDKFNAGSSKYITIVEGEDDALSAYQMLGHKLPVVALPSASISHKLLQNCHEYLDSFDTIVVCTDNDKAGDAAADKLANSFPNKVYRVSLSKHNDPNDFLTAGDSEEFVWAWRNKTKHVPDGFFNTADQFKEMSREKESSEYVETGISDLDDKIKGLMQGHLTVITGLEGQGKTEIMRSFEYSILKNTDKSIGVLHMEESKKTCLMSYLCYELEQNVRDPDHTVPQDKIDKAIEDLTKGERLFLFDFNIDDDPTNILDKVRYLKEACGCDYIFIDPIQQLAYGKDPSSTEEQVLTQVSVQLGKLATQLNVGIVMTAHVNDDGQTRSSRMIGKTASVRVDLKRDHMSDDPVIRNTTKLSISKNRPTGMTGYGGQVTFDPETFTIVGS